MELIDFLGLSEADQWEEFWDKCKFLEHYIDVDVKHHLYCLHGFYVELSSDADGKLVPVMNAFLEGPRLDKYRQGDIEFIKSVLRFLDN